MFDIASTIPGKYHSSFTDQLVRATLSITNNIAEGTGRRTVKQSNQFFDIAKGSVYETINILTILSQRKLISLTEPLKWEIYTTSEEICKMLSGLMKRN